MRRQIYLVPGFFGFTALGEVNYFRGVQSALVESLEAEGVSCEVVECATQPTGSIRRRTERILDTVVEQGGLEADELHFVGHSTGGLDVRLLTTPGVRLRATHEEARILEKTRSVITMSTPHFGTPLATLFTTLPGRHILEVLALLATTGTGRFALYRASRLMKLIARADDFLGRRNTFLDVWVERLIGQITRDPDDPVWDFFKNVASDQGAIIQLTPESLDLFNAAVVDSEHLRYGCVVTSAPPPPFHYDMNDVKQLTRLLFASAFTILHTLTSREHRHYAYPHPGERILGGLSKSLGFEVGRSTNDGIVPAMSQVYGDVLHVARADHLDVVGQYDTGEKHSDWLPSGAGFDGEAFRTTWAAVADFIRDASSHTRQWPGADSEARMHPHV